MGLSTLGDLENELSASFSVGTFPVDVVTVVFA
jgi:hypothetical protein